MPRVLTALRAAARAVTLALPLAAVACNQGDVGAPCNHGSVEAPSSKLVTFPALSCDDLLCVYGEEKQIPLDSCNEDSQCNAVGGEKVFACNTNTNECELALDYVLNRSMCSKRCSSDDDCKNTSVSNRPVAKETNCKTGFACARIQQLGEFCCEQLCVCNDDLPDTTELDMLCQAGKQPGCEDYVPG